MRKNYSKPEAEFIMFSEADIIRTSVDCSTPDTEYYEGVNTYAGDACFSCTVCDD